MTKATMRRGTPIASIRYIALGSAASDDAVEKAISAGSFTAARNAPRGTRASRATGYSTTSPNTTRAMYSVRTTMARFCSFLSPPGWPTVTARAAATANGANFMTIPVNLNITSATASQNASIVSLDRPRTCVRPIANSTDQKTICSISLRAAASKKLCGTRCSSTVANVTGSAAAGVAATAAPAAVYPQPGFRTVTAANTTHSPTPATTSEYTDGFIADPPTSSLA